MNISLYIRELLYDHDCVILPGFGGFVGSYSPARVHPVQHTFHPPSKAILFNASLKNNDGLLANYICSREGVAFVEALRAIDAFAAGTMSQLRSGGKFRLEELGTFHLDKENNLQFEPDISANYLSSSFGLSSFTSPAIRRSGTYQQPQTLQPRIPAVRSARRVTTVMKMAASYMIPFAVAASLGYFYFTSVDSFYRDHASILPSSPVVKEWFSENDAAQPFKMVESVLVNDPAFILTSMQGLTKQDNSIAYNSQEDAPSQPSGETILIPIAPAGNEVAIEPALPEKYFIMVGAFRVKENADNLVSRLCSEGLSSRIVDETRTGLYRVCSHAFAEETEALHQLTLLQNERFPQAWMLTR